MSFTRFKNRIKSRIGKILGFEPYVKLSQIERNLLEMGYRRADARLIIYAYKKAVKMSLNI